MFLTVEILRTFNASLLNTSYCVNTLFFAKAEILVTLCDPSTYNYHVDDKTTSKLVTAEKEAVAAAGAEQLLTDPPSLPGPEL